MPISPRPASPAYWLRPEFCTGGCQAKLAMFEKGVLPEDLPALYIDLDTMVMGDMRAVIDALKTPQSVAILQSAVLPFGGFARWLKRATKGKRYARGNSSVVAFHPRPLPLHRARVPALGGRGRRAQFQAALRG